MHLCSAHWSPKYGFHKTKFIKFFALFLIKNGDQIKKINPSAYSLDKKKPRNIWGFLFNRHVNKYIINIL